MMPFGAAAASKNKLTLTKKPKFPKSPISHLFDEPSSDLPPFCAAVGLASLTGDFSSSQALNKIADSDASVVSLAVEAGEPMHVGGAIGKGCSKERRRKDVVQYCDDDDDKALATVLLEFNEDGGCFKGIDWANHCTNKKNRTSLEAFLSKGTSDNLRRRRTGGRDANSARPILKHAPLVDLREGVAFNRSQDMTLVSHDNTCMRCQDVGELLCCDAVGCSKAVHLPCLLPPLLKVPKGEWFCPQCVLAHVGGGAGDREAGIPKTSKDPSRKRSASLSLSSEAVLPQPPTLSSISLSKQPFQPESKATPFHQNLLNQLSVGNVEEEHIISDNKEAAASSHNGFRKFNTSDDENESTGLSLLVGTHSSSAAAACETSKAKKDSSAPNRKWVPVPSSHFATGGRFRITNCRGEGVFLEHSTGRLYCASAEAMTQTRGDEFTVVRSRCGAVVLTTHGRTVTAVLAAGGGDRACGGVWNQGVGPSSGGGAGGRAELLAVFEGFDEDAFFQVLFDIRHQLPTDEHHSPRRSQPAVTLVLRHSTTGLWLTSAKHCRKDSSRALLLSSAMPTPTAPPAAAIFLFEILA